jgi:hypothetical protein
MMQPSCPGLSLVMPAGFTVTTLRQSNNPPNTKVQTHQTEKGKTGKEQAHHFL